MWLEKFLVFNNQNRNFLGLTGNRGVFNFCGCGFCRSQDANYLQMRSVTVFLNLSFYAFSIVCYYVNFKDRGIENFFRISNTSPNCWCTHHSNTLYPLHFLLLIYTHILYIYLFIEYYVVQTKHIVMKQACVVTLFMVL